MSSSLPNSWVAPPGYLDALAGVPMGESVRAAWSAAAGLAWSDPARLHHPGRTASLVLDQARASLQASLALADADIFFTASTASALTAIFERLPHRVVVTGAVETQITLDTAALQASTVHVLPVTGTGAVDLSTLDPSWQPQLAVLQVANAEVGTVQPVEDLSRQLAGVPMVCDATACLGRIVLPKSWSVLFASARDFGGPAGVTIVAARKSLGWSAPSASERGWLGGFPDIPAVAAAAIAAESLPAAWQAEASRAHQAIADLRQRISDRIPDVDLVGDPEHRLPHVLTFSALYCPGEALVSELDRAGIFVASGSACTADTRRPSHVLAAMGALTGDNLRISLPLGFDSQDVDRLAELLVDTIAKVRADVGY